ncbi:MAG TPA: HAMP domain-containing sensor histidine kinase [Blastocatellia bacterium]|jgi:signal transduction histidine kinase|nr:HAMP domain-containing sensor histidine kinase [Blastocatellia bacterium]
MSRLELFLKRHLLWVGALAVAVPLVFMLRLQYNSLVELERTSAVDHKMTVRTALEGVATEIKYFYQNSAEQKLNIHSTVLASDGICPNSLCFKSAKSLGAKRIFVADFKKSPHSLLFYNPANNQMEPAAPDAMETRAVNVACAPWRVISEEGTTVESRALRVDERDPENRILLKPIVDEWSRVAGVAGMIVDNDFFLKTVLPGAIEKYFPKRQADDDCIGVILTAQDGGDNVMLASGTIQDQAEEMDLPLQFVFTDWRLKIYSRDMTPEQIAHSNFALNLSLSLLMTLVLLGGIVMTLRAASREMKLSEMKTDFVSNVSHELRTPLSSIRVFGEFLTLGRVKEPEKIREYGQYIETESRRLTQLINNILDFSKIESSQKQYQFEKADVDEVISETLKMFEVRLKQDDFTITCERPPRALPRAIIDAEAIAQAFVNLVDNAVKYSGSCKEIFVRLGQKDGEITIAVTDKGMGIPQIDQDKIFEKFYRVSTGLVHDVKGSGLGLSIVKHIVQAHRGRVTVESEYGSGSTFTIHLPVAESVKVESMTDEPEAQKARPLNESDPALGLGVKI